MSKKKPQAITMEQADAIERKIRRAYIERADYPPFALISWDDRHLWTEYITKTLLQEMARGTTQKE